MIFFLGITLENILLVILGSYLYLLFFGISTGGILYAYTTDFMPGVALSIAGISQWLLGLLITTFTINLVDSIGIQVMILTFLLISVLGGVLVHGFGIETSGKERTQIKEEFKKKKFFK